MRKIVSFLLIAVFLIVPVSAASSSNTDVEYIQKSSFWTWAAGKGKPLNGIIGNTFGAVCPNSEDGYHHASSYERPIGNWTVESGYYKCICDLCGAEFKAYEKDLQQSYDAQVAELPALGYSSDGSLLISCDIYRHRYKYSSGSYNYFDCDGHEISQLSSCHGAKVDFLCSSNRVMAVVASGNSSFSVSSISFWGKLVAPYDGFYQQIESPKYNAHLTFVDGTSEDDQTNYVAGSAPVYYSAGSTVFYDVLFYSSSGENLFSYDLIGYPAYYKFTPAPSVDINFDTTYNINSRPTSITGDYGIIGDNGQIIKVEGDKIVNETNNTYYNPATGETTTITDWSYNYEDRSYTVTTESGDTVTITYGDENVTIKEGDTIYNVYYLVNGSGSEGPGPDVPPACNHQWTETSTTPATCTVPGSRALTCSLCNETKTETIPAPGHKWTIKQEVKNEYDENGNQTQQGYTIWECSVCGEQQKTTDGTAPPGGGSGTGSGSSGGVFSGIFGLLVDFLGFFWNTFRDFVGEGVKGFLSALMDGTSSIFGLLNPFNWGG